MSKQAETTTASATSNSTSSKARSPFELPFAMPMMPDAFAQLMRDQIARTQAVMGELASYEGQAVTRARTAVDELSRLANDSITYVGQLSAEWRKLSLEAMQRTVDAFTPKA
ncbi:MAG: hypothetical protein KBG48_14400 [Kofleriaceae bacterium]|jgi:hypothetical protein|nr:hypothetical protein [Kofleriaceae bacterium]MBP9168583.1 hypothetical protein [Kofleriaceae bacterium]MBP9859217.1 hypothetical protein [Kofleriaceae bacterium]